MDAINWRAARQRLVGWRALTAKHVAETAGQTAFQLALILGTRYSIIHLLGESGVLDFA